MTASFSVDDLRPGPIHLPAAWPGRPWIYGNVIASADRVVTWSRAGRDDDPVRAIAGGDLTRPGRLADRRLMRRLRAAADAVSFGAQTLRDQPDLIGAVDDVDRDLAAALLRFRAEQGRPPIPLQVLYSASGQLDLAVPMLDTAGLAVVVVTTEHGARRLRGAGSDGRGIALLVAGDGAIGPAGLVRAHERLLAEFGVRHLLCEGGVVTLDALQRAGILDEIFVTVTEVRIDRARHEGVKALDLLARGGARLVAEVRSAADPGYRFQRWRFNDPGGRPSDAACPGARRVLG